MLKIADAIDERIGGRVMRWWDGQGAARVYAYDDETGTLLLERATGSKNLLQMATSGDDDAATRIVCETVGRLHVKRSAPTPQLLLSLPEFFISLDRAAAREGGFMQACRAIKQGLLDSPRDPVVLHGDAHHSNILDFGERGWLAIDPKRVVGERYYDYVNVLCNPDLVSCVDAKRFARQVEVIVDYTGLERNRLLKWVVAHAALSAAWFQEDEDFDGASRGLEMARVALACVSDR